MADEHIVPNYKLLLAYDIDASSDLDSYYQFVSGEFLPAVQQMGLYMLEAWHTAYGAHPIRLTGFVAEDMETISDALDSEVWRRMEDKLLRFVSNYTRRVVRFREGFQFFLS